MHADHRFGFASTAKIAGHPIHPMLVPFPIAFLIGALLCDLVFWGSRGDFWATAAVWLVGAGIVGGIMAALAGVTDFLGNERIRDLSDAWHHFLGNGTAVVVAIVNLVLRLVEGPAPAVLPWGLVLSFVTVAILGYTGWLGGELVYRHGVGLPEAAAGHTPGEAISATRSVRPPG